MGDAIWPVKSDTGVLLRPIRDDDADAYVALVNDNIAFLHPWVHPPANPAAFAEFVRKGRGSDVLWMAVCLEDTEALIGNINFSQIVYGNFCSAYTGFWIAEPYAGRGLMAVALRLAISVAFTHLGLHRLEANIQPANLRSRMLVERVGFRLEGYSPRYLRIDEKWVDHERWAICAEDVA